ncbi:SDR family oxidoreductase [soil metagenome]
MQLSEANIIITGGARGIGNFLALELAQKVNKVFIIDNNEALLAEIPSSEKVLKFKCDVTNSEEVERVISKIYSDEGSANVLINNAGIIHSEPLINLMSRPDRKHSITNWNKVVNVNLNSVFYVTANVVDQMVARKIKGVIINISSISAQGNAGQSAYSATKAAVEALTKTWSKELGMFKIRSVCIAPGFFNTPSTRESLSEGMLAKWEKGVPLGRLGDLNELLLATEFLIQNNYYNGRILQVDGGLNI